MAVSWNRYSDTLYLLAIKDVGIIRNGGIRAQRRGPVSLSCVARTLRKRPADKDTPCLKTTGSRNNCHVLCR